MDPNPPEIVVLSSTPVLNAWSGKKQQKSPTTTLAVPPRSPSVLQRITHPISVSSRVSSISSELPSFVGSEIQAFSNEEVSEDPTSVSITSESKKTSSNSGFVPKMKCSFKKWLQKGKMSSSGSDHNFNDDSSHSILMKCRQKDWYYFNPMNDALYWWITVVIIAIIYNCFMIIARDTFTQLQNAALPLWLFLDYLADLIYILDIVAQLYTGHMKQGLLVTKNKDIGLSYIKSLNFKLDVLSILPTDLLYLISELFPNRAIVRINRVIKWYRLRFYIDRVQSRFQYPNVIRVINLLLHLLLIIHWNACIYFIISKNVGFGSDTWVYPSFFNSDGNSTAYATLRRQYLYSFYWSTLTLTTVGELPPPQSDFEFFFVTIDFLVGVVVFAVIVGMVSGIITNLNARKAQFQERLDNIKQYMIHRGVSKIIRTRVIKWFNYLWANNHTPDEQQLAEDLPKKLRAEIAIHVHFNTLRHVKIFEECEAGLLEELVLKLRPQLFSPGDFVCRKGEIGREMYIIKHGILEVINDDGYTMATLTDGNYFGEISILNLEGTGNRRTASVRSSGYSDLFCLSKCDLLETLKEYPEARLILVERGTKTLLKDREIMEEIQKNPSAIEMSPMPTRSPALLSQASKMSIWRYQDQFNSKEEETKESLWQKLLRFLRPNEASQKEAENKQPVPEQANGKGEAEREVILVQKENVQQQLEVIFRKVTELEKKYSQLEARVLRKNSSARKK